MIVRQCLIALHKTYAQMQHHRVVLRVQRFKQGVGFFTHFDRKALMFSYNQAG